MAKIGVVAEEADDRATVEALVAEAKELRAIFAASYKTSRRGGK